MNEFLHDPNWSQARRQFLKTSGMGIAASALGALLPQSADAFWAALSAPHGRPRAKRVIFMFMAGAPSQLDLFDYKPDLHKRFRRPLPPSISMGQRGGHDQGQGTARCAVDVRLPSDGQQRHLDERSVAAHVQGGRRSLHRKSLNTNAINHDPPDPSAPVRNPRTRQHGSMA